jgi:diguanylate cyclase (GGDEF)-like protein/PAS domain S-box-containing protein
MNQSEIRILVVDDDEDDYFLTHAILVDVYGERINVEWISAYDAAIETLLAGRHELCFLDYHLGARTGLELLREALARGCRTPIIMLTGNGDCDVDESAMEAGAADYLIKGRFGGPHLERSIRCALGFALERHQALDALKRAEERYALAWRGTNDGLWDWNFATNRIYYSPRWKSILGYDDEQIADSTLEWFNRVHPLELDRVKAEISAHVAGRVSHLESEHRVLHRDGAYRWVLTRGLAVRDEEGTVVRMAGSLSDITHRKAADQRSLDGAFRDPLTGLASRPLLLDRLGHAIARAKRRPDSRFGVLSVGIEGLRQAHQRLGRPVRDQLLCTISRRLESCLREIDTLARVNEDEFAGLIDDVETTDLIFNLVDRILENLRGPFTVGSHELALRPNIGIALNDGADLSAEEFVRNAHVAMRRAKPVGDAGFVIFDEAMLRPGKPANGPTNFVLNGVPIV